MVFFFFFKQKTAYEIVSGDWSSDVCSSDLDKAGIPIPRFCYHEKLPIAANCRMCLVDVEKMPKPAPACATPVMEGMKVYTQTRRALDAQRNVMEFLLIN